MGLKTAASCPLARDRPRNPSLGAGASANRNRSRFSETEMLGRYSSVFLGVDCDFAGKHGS